MAAANGTTYYVDSVSGSDDHSGLSPRAAWKSLSKVNVTIFSPGDHILFMSGAVWVGQLWPKGSGRDGLPIVIDKYGGEAKPIINGAGQAEDTLLLRNQEYWEVRNLELTNRGATPALRRAVHVTNENYGEMHHIYVRGLRIHDVNGIEEPKHNGGISYTSDGEIKPSRFVDLRIEDNDIRHVDRSGIFGWSSHWPRSKWFPSLGVVVRNNVLDDIGGDGIVVVATDGALVERNVVSRANQRSEGYNVAIWAWSADHTVIQHNEAFLTHGYRDGEGFDSDWNSRNTIIQYNYSHDNDGGFLLICNEGGHPTSSSIGNSGTVVRYNISQNDHTRGINIAGPVDGARIYNNTIFVGKKEDVALLLYSDWHGWAHRIELYNNVFYVEGKARFSYGVSRDSDGKYRTAPGVGNSRDNVFDYNVYFGGVPALQDPHALRADPLLENPGAATTGLQSLRGYLPRSASPLIDSGRTIDGNGGADFFGSPVPSCGSTDRGASEIRSCAKERTLEAR